MKGLKCKSNNCKAVYTVSRFNRCQIVNIGGISQNMAVY